MSNDSLQKLEQYDEEEDKSIWTDCDIQGYENFRKDNENSEIWWTSKIADIGELNISFDKKKIYNLYKDYPYNMTEKEIEIFEKEEPYWAKYCRYTST